MDDLFGWSNGSTDDSNTGISNLELFRLFKYTNTKIFLFLLIILNILDSTFTYIRVILHGKLGTILIESNYESPSDFLDAINYMSTLIILSIIARFIANIFDASLQSLFEKKMKKEMHIKTMSKLLDQDISYFDNTLTGTMLSRLTNDISNSCDALTQIFFNFIYCLYDFLCGLIICLFQSWKISFFVLCCFPIYGLSQLLGNKYVTSLYKKYNEKNTKASSKAEEILNCFRTIRSFDTELHEYHNYRKHLLDVHEIVTQTSLIRGLQNSIESLIHWSLTSLILFYTGIQAINKEIDPGIIVTIISILDRWSFSISGIFDCLYDLKKANVSAAKLIEIIEREPSIKNDEGTVINGRINGVIEFKNVTFKYPSRRENAIENLSFKIKQNETVALVGESGCGKSTILQLIQRFYDVDEGQILLDGIDIKKLKPSSIRSQISIVQQRPVIFSMSVKDNIRFGKPHAHKEDVIHSAFVANPLDFIVHLKEGYKTIKTYLVVDKNKEFV